MLQEIKNRVSPRYLFDDGPHDVVVLILMLAVLVPVVDLDLVLLLKGLLDDFEGVEASQVAGVGLALVQVADFLEVPLPDAVALLEGLGLTRDGLLLGLRDEGPLLEGDLHNVLADLKVKK